MTGPDHRLPGPMNGAPAPIVMVPTRALDADFSIPSPPAAPPAFVTPDQVRQAHERRRRQGRLGTLTDAGGVAR